MTTMPRPAGRRYHSLKDVAMDLSVASAQGIWERRDALVPTLSAVGVAPTALITHGLAQIDGATGYVAGAGGLAIAAAAAAAYTLPDGLRGAGYTTVAGLGAVGTWAAIDPANPHPWGALALTAMACQATWIVGRAMVATDKTAKAKKKGDRLVEAARWDGHVAAVSRTRGYTEWKIALGIGTRAASIKIADVSHILSVTPDRVHVWPGATSREATIRLMHKRPSSKPVRHPALAKATADEWAPGSRTVVDPIPIGPSPAGLADPVTMSPRPDDDVSHLLVAGATGSGKSYSLASLLTGLMACGDVILAGADVAKAGQTLHPFRPAFAQVTTTMDGLMADLVALGKLSKARIARMNGEMCDKWDPRVHGPLVVYVLEEWAATLAEAGDDKETLSSMVDALAATVRSAGICLLVCTQRPDAESMGSTRLRSNVMSAMIHKVLKRSDLMGLLPGEDLDLSVLTRKGDALVACGTGGVTRARAWKVDHADRYELAQRYAERPGVTPPEAEILTSAGWTVATGAPAPQPTHPAPEWAANTLAQIDALDEVADDDIDILGAVPVDAPTDVILFALVEALGDAEWITTDDAIVALGWGGGDDTARNTAKTRLSRAVAAATGDRVKPTTKRVPGSSNRVRCYTREDLAAALAPPAE
jgi:hypothetical protein